MKLDNSQMKTWFECPWKWKEKYVNKIERRIKTSDALAFGKRMHTLFECRLKNVDAPPCAAEFEDEAQEMFALYCAKYPVEAFDVVDVERYFEVPLPGTEHIYCGKFDGIVRAHDTGMLNILEHKTEKRGGKQNLPEAWAVRPQVSLYLWAAEQVYGEKIDQIILDVATRRSPAGREAPVFSRQHLQRTPEQCEDAVRNITWVADQMEAMLEQYGDQEKWPFNGEQCAPNNWKCDFYNLHIIGRDPFTLERDYQEAEKYLTL